MVGGAPVVHYWADLQSVYRFRRYDNIARTPNVSECLYSSYAWLSIFTLFSHFTFALFQLVFLSLCVLRLVGFDNRLETLKLAKDFLCLEISRKPFPFLHVRRPRVLRGDSGETRRLPGLVSESDPGIVARQCYVRIRREAPRRNQSRRQFCAV